jgi:hypothetical protein
MKEKFFILILILTIFLATSAYAFTASNPNYQIQGIISDGGNNTLQGGNYRLHVIIGQPVVGIGANTNNYGLCLGMLCWDIFWPSNQINLKGQLFYENGTVVSNSDIIVNATYKGSQWKQSNKTDNNGNFFVRVNNIPAYLRYRQFKVQIFARGDVDALYECLYNPTTEKCA